MTKPNHSDGFQIHYKMLTITGAWPIENPSFWYKFRGYFLFSATVVLGITMTVETIKDITDFTKLSEILYIMVTVTTYNVKHISFWLHRKTFVYMIKLLKDPIFMSYPDDLNYLTRKRTKISRFVTNFYGYLVFVCVLLMAASPLLDGRYLPFPFSFDLGRYRYLMWFVQSSSDMVVGWNNPCLDSLAASLIGIAATQLEILGHKLMRARNFNFEKASDTNKINVKTVDNEKVVETLKECVKHHLAIIDYIYCVDKIFSFCILMQFLGSVIIICNTLFHFVLVSIGSAQFFVLVNYLAVLLSQLFMYCWFGNEVIYMSQKVVQACYFLEWYNCNNEVRKYLFIIMERSKRPLKVTVFKFSDLSLNSFTTIMQWSYSYFALLMKLYNKKHT